MLIVMLNISSLKSPILPLLMRDEKKKQNRKISATIILIKLVHLRYMQSQSTVTFLIVGKKGGDYSVKTLTPKSQFTWIFNADDLTYLR